MIVKSGNMSLGVNLLAALTRRVRRRSTARSTSRSWKCITTRRSTRRPAPRCCSAARRPKAAASSSASIRSRARDGHTGARKAGDIGFAALRGGSVVGEHSVIFAGPAERIELTHKAEDRMIFARGALHAARWARGQKPGLYSMIDVLGLKDF